MVEREWQEDQTNSFKSFVSTNLERVKKANNDRINELYAVKTIADSNF